VLAADAKRLMQDLIDHCDPVFERARATFHRQVLDGSSLLYSADPIEFLLKYPDSEVDESYGNLWPPLDVDYWVQVSPGGESIRVVAEGWQQPERFISLLDPSIDVAQETADHFARLLLR
jgi:hypothetical protein